MALCKQIFASDLYTKHTLLCDTIIRKVFNSKTPPCSCNIEIIIFFYCIFNSQPEKSLPFPPKAHLYSIPPLPPLNPTIQHWNFGMINFNIEENNSFDSVAIETQYWQYCRLFPECFLYIMQLVNTKCHFELGQKKSQIEWYVYNAKLLLRVELW